jgi:hypothetical protein
MRASAVHAAGPALRTLVTTEFCLEFQVRKTPSWANFSILQLHSQRNAWANLHRLGQRNTFLAPGAR